MLKKHFHSLFSRAALVAAVSLASAGAAQAGGSFYNFIPDPFVGQTVNLETAAGSLIALPGVGPGGATLYTNDFSIGGFTFPSVAADGNGGLVNTYSATFNVLFYNQNGTPADLPGTTTQGSATLTGDFVVDFYPRSSPFGTGTYDLTLDQATFHGTSNLGSPLTVDLANIPSAQVAISGPTANGYLIDYLTNFVIEGQYYNNSTGTGPANSVPPTGDANTGGNSSLPSGNAPEPASLALLAAGMLGWTGLRRRRA